jgi:phosphoglycolate phosphatase-like HAD superfamily hydrolase
MEIDINKYNTFIFDCDGVLLDSNKIKTSAFYEVALSYGKDAAFQLREYHIEHGGVSRFEKFKYLFNSILQIEYDQKMLDLILDNYGEIVKQKLLTCNITNGLLEFLSALPKSIRKIVVSGGMQSELREVFNNRGLNIYFEDIYGSPDTKKDILSREKDMGLLIEPALFFGDSRLDYEIASEFGMDFVFISNYSEFKNWVEFFYGKNVNVANDFADLKLKNLY